MSDPEKVELYGSLRPVTFIDAAGVIHTSRSWTYRPPPKIVDMFAIPTPAENADKPPSSEIK